MKASEQVRHQVHDCLQLYEQLKVQERAWNQMDLSLARQVRGRLTGQTNQLRGLVRDQLDLVRK